MPFELQHPGRGMRMNTYCSTICTTLLICNLLYSTISSSHNVPLLYNVWQYTTDTTPQYPMPELTWRPILIYVLSTLDPSLGGLQLLRPHCAFVVGSRQAAGPRQAMSVRPCRFGRAGSAVAVRSCRFGRVGSVVTVCTCRFGRDGCPCRFARVGSAVPVRPCRFRPAVSVRS